MGRKQKLGLQEQEGGIMLPYSFVLPVLTFSVFSAAYISCDQEQKQAYFNICEAEAKEAYLEAEIFQNKEEESLTCQ